MATERINSKDVIQPGIFDDTIQGGKALILVLDDVINEFKEISKESKKLNFFDPKTVDEIEKLEKQVSELNKEAETLTGTIRTQEKAQRRVKELTIEEAVEKEKLRRQTKDLRDEAKKLVAEERNELGLLPKLREENKKLRLERDKLTGSEEDFAEQIEAINAQIDANTELIKENVDANTQAKINVGNYTESIKEALDQTQLYNGELGGVIGAFKLIINSLGLGTKAQEANTKATGRATKEQSKYQKTLRSTGKAVRGLGILAAVTAVGSFAASIRTSEKDAIEYNKVLNRVQVTIGLLIGKLAQAKDGIVTLFSGVFQEITTVGKAILGLLALPGLLIAELIKVVVQALDAVGLASSGALEKIKGITSALEGLVSSGIGGLANLGDGFSDIASGAAEIFSVFENIGEEIKSQTELSDQLVDNQFAYNNLLRETNLEVAKLTAEQERLSALADDDTSSLQTQLRFRRLAAEEAEKAFDAQIKLSELSLKNARTQAQIEFEANTGRKLTQEQLKNILADEERRGFISTQTRDELLQAELELIEVEKQRTLFGISNATERRKVERDLFEQNLDLLIDLIDQEKNLSEQFVNDTSRNIQARINEFESFLLKFRENVQKELNEFNKFSQALGRDIDFNVQFDDDGSARIFAGDTELALGNIEELNKQLQGLGLSEIEVNRFRELVIETNAAKRDFIDLGKAVREFNLAFAESQGQKIISERELEDLRRFNDELSKITDEEELEEAAKRRVEINRQVNRENLINRRSAIDEQLKLVEEGSQDELDLIQERINVEKQLLEQEIEINKEAAQERIDAQKRADEEILENRKKLGEALNAAATLSENIFEERSERRLNQLDVELEAIQERQRQIAEAAVNGSRDAQNSLAEAEKREAELREERERELKRQQRTEFALALFKSYSSNLENGSETALQDTLRDAITLREFAANLPAFYKGSDRIGDDSTAIRSGNDGHLIWADKEEMLLNPVQSSIVRGLGYDRDSLVNLAMNANRVNQGGVQAGDVNNVINVPAQRMDVDSIEKVAIETIEYHNRIVNHRKRLKKSWRT